MLPLPPCPVAGPAAGRAPAVASRPPAALPRAEFPNPQFERKEWVNLNGPWRFAFDDADAGMREAWYGGGRRFDKQIVVPFAFESPKSGIGDPTFHPVVWYQRDVTVPAGMEGAACPPQVRGRGLPGHGLAERAAGRRSRGRQHAVRVRRDRPAEGRRERARRARRRSADRPLHPAWQAVLEGEVREHLLHPDDRHLADGLARGGRRQLPLARAHPADDGWRGAVRCAAGTSGRRAGAARGGELRGYGSDARRSRRPTAGARASGCR